MCQDLDLDIEYDIQQVKSLHSVDRPYKSTDKVFSVMSHLRSIVFTNGAIPSELEALLQN